MRVFVSVKLGEATELDSLSIYFRKHPIEVVQMMPGMTKSPRFIFLLSY